MKVSVSARAAICLATLGLSSLAAAQGSDAGDAIGWPMDLHGNNRAVAFGSALLVGEGQTVDDWQAVQAFQLCSPIPIPDPSPVPPGPVPPLPSDPTDPTDPSLPIPSDPLPPSPPSDCGSAWDVLVTTAYRLEVCPDGRAFIVRSGIGVTVHDRHTGDFFAWAEGVACGPGAKGGTETSPLRRPLTLENVKKTPR